MFACDGRVTTVDACAAVNRTPPAARRSIHGVATLLLPYAPTASARSVSIVIRRTFCDPSRRTRVAFDEGVHADRSEARTRMGAKTRAPDNVIEIWNSEFGIQNSEREFQIPNSEFRIAGLSPCADGLACNRPDGRHNVARGNAVPVEQLFGLAAAR